MLENEEFMRLPLPSDYDLQKEMYESLKQYPDLDIICRNIKTFRPGR